MLAEAPGPAAHSEEAARLFAVIGQRTAPVQSYTSKLHVDFALRSFPYLKFHLEGRIEYKRPNLYSEHFDVASIAHEGERTLVEMRDKVAGNVKAIHAELDSDGLRRIQWHYVNGGRIDVRVNPVLVEGIPVPASEDADIKLPAYHVVAHATFTEYKIVTDSVATTNTGR